MLREVNNPRQIPGEQPRRWFSDDDMDLVVWLGEDESIQGFQLAYDKARSEHALTWRNGSGFQHNRIDDGEGQPGHYKATPILVPDGKFSALELANRFKESALRIDQRVSQFVFLKLIGLSKVELET